MHSAAWIRHGADSGDTEIMNYFLSLLLLFIVSAAGAATPREMPPPPRLTISAPTEKPVTLESVKIATDIRGSLAVTSVEMRFFNPNARQLEGELQFPLLDGQGVIGMAMDVNGKLREAVPVDKARGQEVFEEVTRAQIDPALLQVTKGNNYKLRVFPILPGAYKTVVIRYMESLRGNGNLQVYRLPLSYAERLAAFDLTITVTEKPAQPSRGTDSLGELAFERSGRFYTAHVTREKFAARGVLELNVPSAERAQVYTQVHDGRTYFYTEVPVTAALAARSLPKSVSIIWDASGSGAQRDHARELQLLEAYFQKAQNVEVRLTKVRDATEPAQSFSVRGGDWRTLRRALESTVYDGATNFGAFVPEAKPAVQEYLLFTDGLRNFGSGDLPALRVPVYAISSSTQSDPAWLAHVAHRGGGRYINLITETAADAAKELLSHSTRLASVDQQGASQVVAASPYPENGLIRLAGVMTAPRARLQLGIAAPGAAARTLDVDVSGEAVESPFAALMWANLRVMELDADYRLHRAEIRRLGKAFGITTRETSLIVLDRIEDYVRFEIVPPPELRAEYDRLQLVAQQRRTTERGSQLERIVKLFEQKKAWWAREFPKGERPQAAIAKADGRVSTDSMSLNAQQAPRPNAIPAPPPRVAAERRAESDRPPAAPVAGAAAPGTSGSGAPQIGIQLRRWTPDAPYIARLAKADPSELYRIYLDERPSYVSSTAFFLDAADLLLDKGQTELGVRVLSNLAEMDLENRHVLRILGHRLLQAAKPRLAIPVFQQVLELSPEEPQSYRDLGLAYAADKQYQKAVDALYEVVVRPWHARFPEIELIAIAELNAIVVEAQKARTTIDVSRVDPRLLTNLPLDVRVIVTWDADNTDIDLWVTDPNGEKGYYGNRMTYQGGRMSPDFTGGYGPEEFSLRKAKPGKYLVQVNFYGHRRTTVSGATTLQVKLITGFGTERPQERVTTLRLRDRAEVVTIGEFEVK